jgi:hypothetical protein
MYIVARYRDKKYEISMRQSYRENGLLIDNQNGEITKVSNKPSFMQIVK